MVRGLVSLDLSGRCFSPGQRRRVPWRQQDERSTTEPPTDPGVGETAAWMDGVVLGDGLLLCGLGSGCRRREDDEHQKNLGSFCYQGGIRRTF